jgi:hypothetical protein
MRWIFVLSVLFMCGQTQEPRLPEPTTLTPSSSRQLGVPSMMFYNVRCDGNGHVFYRLMRADNSLNESVVLRLDLKSETPTVYEQPTAYAGNVNLWEFALTPSGRIWYLDEIRGETGSTALGFDSDGKVTTHTHVDTPPNLFVTSFAVAEDDSLLIGGFFTSDAPSETRGKGYVATFGKTGTLTKDAGAELPSQDLTAFAKGTNNAAPSAAGIDGNFYVLNADNVLVVSQGGEISRRMKFRRPERVGHPYEMALSSGLLSIEFLIPRASGDGGLEPEFVVIETSTGAPYAIYRPTEAMGSTCICFSRQDGYTFSRENNGKVELITAALR